LATEMKLITSSPHLRNVESLAAPTRPEGTEVKNGAPPSMPDPPASCVLLGCRNASASADVANCGIRVSNLVDTSTVLDSVGSTCTCHSLVQNHAVTPSSYIEFVHLQVSSWQRHLLQRERERRSHCAKRLVLRTRCVVPQRSDVGCNSPHTQTQLHTTQRNKRWHSIIHTNMWVRCRLHMQRFLRQHHRSSTLSVVRRI
jgi:hypothetical protein